MHQHRTAGTIASAIAVGLRPFRAIFRGQGVVLALTASLIAGCTLDSTRAPAELPTAAPTSSKPALPARVAKAPATIRVGAAGDVRTIAQAARLANDGDFVEVQAGDYRGDVAVWLQKRLTIRAVGGRAVLIADGKAAEGKGIWVIRNGEFEIEGFDFVGSRVPSQNGAGIRFERGKLTVRNSRFVDNENGILTGNDRNSELTIDRSEFIRNGHGDGYSHNLYVGRIAVLEVTGSHFTGARVGHLLKSRARESRIMYNRLTDGIGGTASYELEFPNGGAITAIGNLIEQASGTNNPTIVSIGAEGYSWGTSDLTFAYNTIVNRGPSTALFVRLAPGHASARLFNNLWVGAGKLSLTGAVDQAGNVRARDDSFVDPARDDFRPKPDAEFIGKAANPHAGAGATIVPRFQLRLPGHLQAIQSRAPLTPGAFQP